MNTPYSKQRRIARRDALVYALARIAIPILGAMPCALLYPLARSAGLLCYRFMGRDRERAMLNLRLAYQDRLSPYRLRMLTKGMFMHFTLMAAECLKLFSRPTPGLISKIRLDHPERLQAALAGKGAVVFTAHAGNWEYLATGLFRNGFTGLVMSRKIRSAQFQKLVKSWRERLGILEWNTEESPKPLLECLRRNVCIGVLNDQDISRASGIFVDFFGIPAFTPRFVSDLSYKTGAGMVPCFDVRRKNGTHIIKIHEGMQPEPGETKDAYALHSQQRYADLLEKAIRRHPTQWVWFHRRWKTRPWEIKG